MISFLKRGHPSRLIPAIALLTACGGTENDYTSIDPGTTYIGNRNAATINVKTAETLSTDAYTGGDGVATASVTVVNALPNSLTNIAPVDPALRSQATAFFFQSTLLSALLENSSGPMTRTPKSEQLGTNGNCGGSTFLEISRDDTSGEFSGTYTFNNYCQNDKRLEGELRVSGIVEKQTYEFNITFDKVRLNDGSSDFTLSGDLYSFSEDITTTLHMHLNIVLKDNINAHTVWVNNMIIDTTFGDDFRDHVLEGRYYDPDLGYVEIEKGKPLRTFDAHHWPTAGSYVIRGKHDSKARITALSETFYQLEIDEDGNNIYDTLTTLTW